LKNSEESLISHYQKQFSEVKIKLKLSEKQVKLQEWQTLTTSTSTMMEMTLMVTGVNNLKARWLAQQVSPVLTYELGRTKFRPWISSEDNNEIF
jgi:hypothetical protein